MRILIGADLVPTENNYAQFEAGEAAFLLGDELLSVLASADYRIFNLEIPLTDEKTPSLKCGPALIAPVNTANGFKAMGIDLFTLANNHIMDQGVQGLSSTFETLKKRDIAFVGAGNTPGEAAKGHVFECDNKKIGVYACAEHEFSIVTEKKAGANPYDALESYDHVASLKEACDYVIVLYHGGKEHYRYPSPSLQKNCRRFIEKGADLVVCQHSHCIGCEEKYGKGTIVYGQGNFLFDHQNNEYWKSSLLVQITDDFRIDYIPLCKHENAVRLAKHDEAESILGEFAKRSEEILQSGAVEEKYSMFAKSMIENYLLAFLGVNRRSLKYRILYRLTGGKYSSQLIKKRCGKNYLLALENFVECEAHRELLLYGLKDIV